MDQEKVFQKFFTLGNSYWLTRFVILRLLGFVYAVAFLVAARQLVPLIGEHGLTPANDSGYLAFPLAWISDHDWRRPDQTARRPVLARSYLPLLSLRDATHPQSDQSLSAFFT